MPAWLYIGIGGFIGANVRYYIATALATRLTTLTGLAWPYGTAFVNVTGSFLLALLLVWTSRRLESPENVRLLIGVGFFGAYTTFSTYANETILLLREDWRVGVGYIVVSNGLCLLGVVLGLALAERWWPS